ILNDAELVFASNSIDWVHIARHAKNVNRHDGPGSLGDPALDRGRIDGEGGGIGVGKYRQSHVRKDGVVTGDERIGRNNPFITSINIHYMKTHDQRGSAAGGGEAGFGAEQLCVALFKLLDMAVGTAEPSAAAPNLEQVGFPVCEPFWP